MLGNPVEKLQNAPFLAFPTCCIIATTVSVIGMAFALGYWMLSKQIKTGEKNNRKSLDHKPDPEDGKKYKEVKKKVNLARDSRIISRIKISGQTPRATITRSRLDLVRLVIVNHLIVNSSIHVVVDSYKRNKHSD